MYVPFLKSAGPEREALRNSFSNWLRHWKTAPKWPLFGSNDRYRTCFGWFWVKQPAQTTWVVANGILDSSLVKALFVVWLSKKLLTTSQQFSGSCVQPGFPRKCTSFKAHAVTFLEGQEGCGYWNKGLGWWSEQASESVQSDWKKLWK